MARKSSLYGGLGANVMSRGFPREARRPSVGRSKSIAFGDSDQIFAISETVSPTAPSGVMPKSIVVRNSGSVPLTIMAGYETYSDETTDSPFSYIDPETTVTEDMLLDDSSAGESDTYIVSVIPTINIGAGIAVTVGSGKTMVIDVLQIGDL